MATGGNPGHALGLADLAPRVRFVERAVELAARSLFEARAEIDAVNDLEGETRARAIASRLERLSLDLRRLRARLARITAALGLDAVP